MNDVILSAAVALCLSGGAIDLVALNLVALPAVHAPQPGEREKPERSPSLVARTSAMQRALDLPPIPSAEERAPRAQPGPIATLEFDVSSRRVDRRGSHTLRETAAQLREASEITVIGHADASGADALNDRLSAQRAAAVVQRLIESGIPKVRVRLAARGEREPRKDGNSRRVEIFVGGRP